MIWQLFDNLPEAESYPLLYDERDGLNVLSDFALADESFANPELVSDRRHRAVIAHYVKDANITPAAIRGLVARHPDTADEAIKRALNRTSFSWEQDGERLLRRFKPDLYERDPLPTPLPTTIATSRRG